MRDERYEWVYVNIFIGMPCWYRVHTVIHHEKKTAIASNLWNTLYAWWLWAIKVEKKETLSDDNLNYWFQSRVMYRIMTHQKANH